MRRMPPGYEPAGRIKSRLACHNNGSGLLRLKRPDASDVGSRVKHMTGQKPLQKFSAGSISCAIWANEATVDGRNVQMLKATVERRFKDASGTWKSSGSFGRNEIPLVMYCLEKAFAYMIEERSVREDDDVVN